MKTPLKSIMIAFLLITFICPVMSEVVKVSLDTNSSWKCLDAEDPGWTDAGYDDSWWESGAKTYPFHDISESDSIWYPGKSVYPEIVYFRKNFHIDTQDVISANSYFGVPTDSNGSVDFYINNHYMGTFNNTFDKPYMLNLTHYIQIGNNVLALKVKEQNYFRFALSGAARYRKIVPIAHGGEDDMTRDASNAEKEKPGKIANDKSK